MLNLFNDLRHGPAPIVVAEQEPLRAEVAAERAAPRRDDGESPGLRAPAGHPLGERRSGRLFTDRRRGMAASVRRAHRRGGPLRVVGRVGRAPLYKTEKNT